MTFIYTDQDTIQRLDIFLTSATQNSRNNIQKLITSGYVKINGKNCQSCHFKLKIGDLIELTMPSIEKSIKKTDYDMEILFTHQDFIIINKAAGILSHPTHCNDANANVSDWFMHSGLFRDDIREISTRIGIVHRLDKDTSGIMILARNYEAQNMLSSLFANRQMHKTYVAFAEGLAPEQKTIEYNIIRNPLNPTKMTHSLSQGRKAITHITRIGYDPINKISKIICKPVTGRTHQIRVHLAAIGHSLIGDKTYGKESAIISRHALHASKLEFIYNGTNFSFEANLPDDLSLIEEKITKIMIDV